MSKVKSIEMAAYVAIGTTTTFTELCTLNISGGGAEASVVDLEACLNDDEIEQTVDLAKNKPMTIQYKKLVATGGTISDSLVDAVKDRTPVKVRIKYPLTVPVYGARTCFISDHDDDQTSRPNHVTCTMQLIPVAGTSGDWTYSTTAPVV
jgi:hypothetical protein